MIGVLELLKKWNILIHLVPFYVCKNLCGEIPCTSLRVKHCEIPEWFYLAEIILFLWTSYIVCVFLYFLMKHHILEAGSAFVFRQKKKNLICSTPFIELFSATGPNGALCFGSRLCFWFEGSKAPNLLDLLELDSVAGLGNKCPIRGPTDRCFPCLKNRNALLRN